MTKLAFPRLIALFSDSLLVLNFSFPAKPGFAAQLSCAGGVTF